jgi:ubiquinone/menaquinone biosynthesis C-methylase UbiE
VAAPRELQGIDSSEGYINFAREQIQERAAFAVGDARTLPYESASFDVVVSGLVLNFVPEPSSAVLEMARITRAGGTVAAYVWDYDGEMQLMRHFWDAAVALNPAALELDEGRRFPFCKPEPLTQLLQNAGFKDVEVRAIDVPTEFKSFDDYWSPFLGGQGPAPGYAISITDSERAKLRDFIHARLPIRGDGSIHLVARSWAVRGKR